MTEKEMFLNAWQREFGTTMKILKQLPADKAGFKPAAAKARSAQELASVFIQELSVVDGVVKGKIEFNAAMPSFSSFGDLLKEYDSKHREMVTKVQAMSDASLNETVAAPVGPKQRAQVRRADLPWLMLHDSIHRRGQCSVYLRRVGAKVPSIYGPSGDEAMAP